MNFKKSTLLLFAASILHAFSLVAQTTQGPTIMPQINTDFYVGQVAGFYPSIQNAVTLRCAAAGLGSRVIIPAGSPADGTSGFTISAVTGGCVKVAIEDRRAIPVAAYKWVTSAYVLQSSGGTPPVVAGSSQYANKLATAPISGGLFNSDAFNTSNNGIATAQGLGLQNILVPYGSATGENELTALTVNNSHLRDERTGALDYYFNTAPNVSSETKWCVDNQPSGSPSAENHNGCRSVLALFSESGMDVTGTPTLYSVDNMIANFFGNGIHQAHSTNITSYTDDDMGGNYTYAHVRAAALAGASEGSVGTSFQGFEDGMVSGTVTTGGSGATTIQTSLTNGGLANSAYIIFPSENVASGYITAFTAGPGGGDRTLGFVTTSDTHAVSSGYGFLTATCGTNNVANNPQPSTCPFTTGTVAGHTGFGSFASGQLVAIADYANFECSVATVSGGNITLNLTRQHPANTPIYQGTGTCAKVMQGRGSSPVWGSTDGFTPNYQIAGANTATTWAVVFPEKNGQNGQNPITLYGPVFVNITSASQTGTTVTLTVSGAGSVFNNLTAPSGASICVSGNSNAAFNQCGITGIVASNSGFTLTYTVGTSATNTGTGGIINVGTTAAPASNGLANYELDCGAIVTKVLGVDNLHQLGNGSVNLQANNCTMAASESFIQPNNPAQAFQGTRVGWNASTPNPGAPNFLHQWYLEGGAFSGATYLRLGVGDSDPISAFQGWGGNQLPRTFLSTDTDVIGTLINMPHAPIGIPSGGAVGGAFASIGPFPAGGIETQYDLFDMAGTGGSMALRVDTANNGVTLVGQGASPFFTVQGPLSSGAGNSFGGTAINAYLNISNLLSDVNNPLDVAEQWNNGTCRGIHFTATHNGPNFDTASMCSSSDFSSNYTLQFKVGSGLPPAMTINNNSGLLTYAFAGGHGLDFGANAGTPAITLYDGGAAGNRYGVGINSQEMQFFISSTPTADHFSWNGGGDFQPSGTNELMRLYATGHLSLGTTADCGVLFGIGSGCPFKVDTSGNVTTPSVTVTGPNHSISTGTASNTDIAGKVTLAAGTFTYTLAGTYTTPPIVTCSDTNTTPTVVGCHTTTTQIIFNGTGTDVINYIMIGLN